VLTSESRICAADSQQLDDSNNFIALAHWQRLALRCCSAWELSDERLGAVSRQKRCLGASLNRKALLSPWLLCLAAASMRHHGTEALLHWPPAQRRDCVQLRTWTDAMHGVGWR
jgi:hypothetical protein